MSKKFIVSLSVDGDDIERIKLAQRLWGIPSRSELVRVAVAFIVNHKLKELNNAGYKDKQENL